MAMRWSFNKATVKFAVDFVGSQGLGWFAVGLSETGSMKGADVWAFIRSADGTWQLTDRYAAGFETPDVDAIQDVTLLRVKDQGIEPDVTLLLAQNASASSSDVRHVTAVFTRLLDTNDTEDLSIQPGAALRAIWAFGGKWGYHGDTNRGHTSLLLLPEPGQLAAPAAAPPGEDTTKLRLVLPPTKIPAVLTTYAYKLFELPSDRKYHITSYELHFASAPVHHAVAYTCDKDTPVETLRNFTGEGLMLNTDPSSLGAQARGACSQFFMLVAPHMPPVVMPPDAGLPFGASPAPSFVLLEVHLNNPSEMEGLVDPGSGIIISYTSKLRPQDVGVMTLGQFALHIPPGLPSFSAPPSACPGTCTKKLDRPVTMLSHVIHMHGLGKSARTRRFRGDAEVAPLLDLAAYDYKFQEWASLPPSAATLNPGERLELTCTFDSTSRTNFTDYGPATDDEMCFHWIMYAPAAQDYGYCVMVGDSGLANCAADDTPIGALMSQNKDAIAHFIEAGQLVPDEGVNTTYKPYVRPAYEANVTAMEDDWEGDADDGAAAANLTAPSGVAAAPALPAAGAVQQDGACGGAGCARSGALQASAPVGLMRAAVLGVVLLVLRLV